MQSFKRNYLKVLRLMSIFKCCTKKEKAGLGREKKAGDYRMSEERAFGVY